MFNSLIDSLSSARLLGNSQKDLLRGLALNSEKDVAIFLDRSTSKEALLLVIQAIGKSRFIAQKPIWVSTIPALLKLLASDDDEIRLEAAITLGYLDATSTLEVLAKIATSDESRYAQIAAIDAIAGWRLPQSIVYLLPIALDRTRDLDVREMAIEAIGISGSTETPEALKDLLHDENVGIRDVTILALHNSQDSAAIPYLEKLLNDQSVTRFGETIAEHVQDTITYLASRNHSTSLGT